MHFHLLLYFYCIVVSNMFKFDFFENKNTIIINMRLF